MWYVSFDMVHLTLLSICPSIDGLKSAKASNFTLSPYEF